MSRIAMRRSPREGFTLVELLVVIVIIAVLMAIIFPVFTRAREKARQAGCANNCRQMVITLQAYQQDNEFLFPDYRSVWKVMNFPTGTTTCPTYGQPNSYGYNITLSGANASSKILQPAKDCVVFADASSQDLLGPAQVSFRHAGKASVAFADGHVSLVTAMPNMVYITPFVMENFTYAGLARSGHAVFDEVAVTQHLQTDSAYANVPVEGFDYEGVGAFPLSQYNLSEGTEVRNWGASGAKCVNVRWPIGWDGPDTGKPGNGTFSPTRTSASTNLSVESVPSQGCGVTDHVLRFQDFTHYYTAGVGTDHDDMRIRRTLPTAPTAGFNNYMIGIDKIWFPQLGLRWGDTNYNPSGNINLDPAGHIAILDEGAANIAQLTFKITNNTTTIALNGVPLKTQSGMVVRQQAVPGNVTKDVQVSALVDKIGSETNACQISMTISAGMVIATISLLNSSNGEAWSATAPASGNYKKPAILEFQCRQPRNETAFAAQGGCFAINMAHTSKDANVISFLGMQ